MNPELRRNLWTELTTHRLIAAPVLFGLVLLLIAAQASEPLPIMFATASTVMVLLVHFWGTRRASEAVTEEVRERTWDWQRLSSLGPWAMTWGKLAGSTAFPWYCAALCIVAMIGVAAFEGTLAASSRTILGLAASAVALHGAALAASIQASRKDSRLGGRIGTLLLIPIALVVALSWVRGTPAVDLGQHAWWGVRFAVQDFMALTAVLFAAWAVLGAYREMQRELHVRALPWAWPAFALFLGLYAAGFDVLARSGRGTGFIFATFFASLLLAYYGLFADVTTAMGLRRVMLHARAGAWRRAAEELPLWASMLPLVAIFAVLAALQPWPEAWNLPQRFIGPFPIAFFLLLLRDAGLLVFFALGPRAKRVEGTTILYLILLYSVLPALFSALGMEVVARAINPVQHGGGWAAAIAAVHVAIVAGAVAVRWRRMERSLGDGPGPSAAL